MNLAFITTIVFLPLLNTAYVSNHLTFATKFAFKKITIIIIVIILNLSEPSFHVDDKKVILQYSYADKKLIYYRKKCTLLTRQIKCTVIKVCV